MSVPDAEKHLWQSVLLLAIEDALISPSGDGEARARLRHCQEARDYLTTPSDDLAFACNHAGIDMVALIERLKVQIDAAPTPEELVANRPRRQDTVAKKVEKPKPVPVTYTFEGEALTITEWSRLLGISTATLIGRLNAGWTVEEAFTTSVAEARRRAKLAVKGNWKRGTAETVLTHEGETLPVSVWAERTGLKKQTILLRLRKGLSVADSLTPANLRGKPLGERFSVT